MKLLKIHHRFPGMSLIAVSALLAALPGCAAPRNCPESAVPASQAGAGVENSPGIHLGTLLLEAMQNGDFETFTALWPDAEVGENEFHTSREKFSAEFGEWKSSRYLTRLQTPLVENHLWVVTFERPASDGSGVIEQQMLFRLVTGEVDGVLTILGLGFL